MPELPEVETIRRQLGRLLKGKTVKDVEIRLVKLVKSPLPAFRRVLPGRRVIGLERRAKQLIINLDQGWSLLFHLKMTGQLVYRKKRVLRSGGHPIVDGTKNLPNKYSHIIFTFNNGSCLFFNDLRRFGFIKLVKSVDLPEYFIRQKTGPEPLSPEFTLIFFQSLLKRRQRVRIKQLIMDQTAIAGLGNIYAVESCFSAGIRPTRAAGTLTLPQSERLYKSIIKILKTAVAKQGSSVDNYIDAFGQPGHYVPQLKVYGRVGLACYRCHRKIVTVRLGGRGTAYCPHCQQ